MSDNTQIGQRDQDAATLRPAVDIFEDSHAVKLLVDLPGVLKEKLYVRVHDGNLTIEAESTEPATPNFVLSHADVRAPYFSRSFTVSDELDASKTEAKLKGGVLRLTIPRRDQAKHAALRSAWSDTNDRSPGDCKSRAPKFCGRPHAWFAGRAGWRSPSSFGLACPPPGSCMDDCIRTDQVQT
jgi:HSP20 family molecular chaperone IbpA